MAQAKFGDTVTVHYTGRLEDGTVFDSSYSHEPIRFTIGAAQVLPDIERAVVDLHPGEHITVEIQADRAFGPHREELVVDVRRDQMLPGIEPQEGQLYEVRKEDGTTAEYRVIEVSTTWVTLDANHPLAGRDLIFDVQLVDIVPVSTSMTPSRS